MKNTLVVFSILTVLVGAACSSGTGAGTGGGGMGGASTQKLPIGSPCAKDADCGGADFMCMTDHPDGYCIKMCDIKNADKDCPSKSKPRSTCPLVGSAKICVRVNGCTPQSFRIAA